MKLLEFIRRQRGLTQAQVGVLAGLSQRAFSAIERGETTPSEDTLALLARSLGVAPPSSLLRDVTAIPEETPAYVGEQKTVAQAS